MRALLAVLFALVLTTTSSAHFVFLVPSADGKTCQVVFSDSLKPDEKVEITKIANTHVSVRIAKDRLGLIKLAKVTDAQAYTFTVPGMGTRYAYGTTNYGVIAKGDMKPYLLRYDSAAVVGTLPAEGNPVGASQMVGLRAKTEAGKLRFQFVAEDKPVADTEVVILFGDETTKVTTAKDGWTPAQDAKPGTYAVRARHTVATGGEFDGKKYEEMRRYATLVVTIGASGK